MQDDAEPTQRCADVVLLVGPSGSGKTYLARSIDLPIVALDDFYRADTDPAMPRLADGTVNWEDPRSWDGEAAADALEALCCGDEVEVPDYSFPDNRAIGTRTLRRDGSCLVVAEGIFAAELIGPLRDRGLLADAMLIAPNRWLTFVRRLGRDLREGRKGRSVLVRQGWRKARDEPTVVSHQRALGARPISKPDARLRLQELAARTFDPVEVPVVVDTSEIAEDMWRSA